jgi:hypothetical protein
MSEYWGPTSGGFPAIAARTHLPDILVTSLNVQMTAHVLAGTGAATDRLRVHYVAMLDRR